MAFDTERQDALEDVGRRLGRHAGAGRTACETLAGGWPHAWRRAVRRWLLRQPLSSVVRRAAWRGASCFQHGRARDPARRLSVSQPVQGLAGRRQARQPDRAGRDHRAGDRRQRDAGRASASCSIPTSLPERETSLVPFRDDGFAALSFSIGPEKVTPILRRLIQPDIRARVYDRDGRLIVDSQAISCRSASFKPPAASKAADDEPSRARRTSGRG